MVHCRYRENNYDGFLQEHYHFWKVCGADTAGSTFLTGYHSTLRNRTWQLWMQQENVSKLWEKVWQQNCSYQLPVTDLGKSGGSQIKSLQIKTPHTVEEQMESIQKKVHSLSQELQTSTSYRGTRNVWRKNVRNFGIICCNWVKFCL